MSSSNEIDFDIHFTLSSTFQKNVCIKPACFLIIICWYLEEPFFRSQNVDKNSRNIELAMI